MLKLEARPQPSKFWSYGSPVLAELATAIERATGLTVNQYEDYDC